MKVQIFAFAFLILASFSMADQQGLSLGDDAPLFKATTDEGSTWDIQNFLGEKYIVVYFYPAAMTGGCTKQACSYRDHREDLLEAGVEVVGISGDKVESLRLFKQAENLNFTLLSDEKGEIAKAFGVPVGDGGSIKRTVGDAEYELVRDITTRRWTFIVGKNSKIIYKNDSVNAENDTEEVLNFIKTQASDL
ncbi:MAG: peroxiredoxin [Bacteroidales bacterium]